MNRYIGALIGITVIFAISGCDIQRLLALKEQCAEPRKLMFCASTPTQYTVFMNEQLLKLSDLNELGFVPDAINGTPDDGTVSYDVYKLKADQREKILTIKVQTTEGYVRRIDFPPSFVVIVPPSLFYAYIEILGKSQIDMKTFSTVPQSPSVAETEQPDFYSRDFIDAILGPPTATKVVGTNRESAVYELSIGKRKPIPMATLVASRRVPSTVQEINLLFSTYRVRMTRSLIDVIVLSTTFNGHADP